MRVLRTLRHAALAFAVLFIAACGGSKDDTTTASTAAPKPSATYAATVPVAATVTLDGSGSTSGSGGPLTYQWTLTSAPAGSSATIASATAVQAFLTPDVVGTYNLTLAVNDGSKSASIPFTVTAVAYTLPTILSDLTEPYSGNVEFALSVDEGASTETWTANGVSLGTGATVTWNTTTVPDGYYLITAQVLTVAKVIINVSRTVHVVQSPVSFTSSTISETAGTFTAVVGAQSVNGILRVDAVLDGVAVGTLAAPNACTDPTGAACASTGPNGYGFSGTIGGGQHVLTVTATDGIGATLGTQLRLNVTDVQ